MRICKLERDGRCRRVDQQEGTGETYRLSSPAHVLVSVCMCSTLALAGTVRPGTVSIMAFTSFCVSTKMGCGRITGFAPSSTLHRRLCILVRRGSNAYVKTHDGREWEQIRKPRGARVDIDARKRKNTAGHLFVVHEYYHWDPTLVGIVSEQLSQPRIKPPSVVLDDLREEGILTNQCHEELYGALNGAHVPWRQYFSTQSIST